MCTSFIIVPNSRKRQFLTKKNCTTIPWNMKINTIHPDLVCVLSYLPHFDGWQAIYVEIASSISTPVNQKVMAYSLKVPTHPYQLRNEFKCKSSVNYIMFTIIFWGASNYRACVFVENHYFLNICLIFYFSVVWSYVLKCFTYLHERCQ